VIEVGMKLRTLSTLAALALMAGSVPAEQRHLGPHVHGQATVEVSLEGPTLEVDLSIPGHDAVGFEHPPANSEQTRALANAEDTLKKGQWLVPAKAAGCKESTTKVVADGFDANAKPGGHSDLDATYRFACDQPEQLDALEVRLAEALPEVQRVVVDIVTANGATQEILDRSTTHVSMSP